jgi:hypothetical protein
MKKLTKLSAAFLTVLALSLSSAPVFAEGTGTTSDNAKAQQSAKVEAAKAKAAAAKEKACSTRKNAVTTIEKRVSNRGQGRLDAITKIATKVENYVQTKNLSVTNYASLVSDVDAKKAAAQTAVDAVKNDPGEVSSVTCSNGDGKAKVEAFKKDMKAQQDALKAYRQSVNNLITAVKAAKTATGGTQQ